MSPFDDRWDTSSELEPDETTLEGLLELLNSQAALVNYHSGLWATWSARQPRTAPGWISIRASSAAPIIPRSGPLLN